MGGVDIVNEIVELHFQLRRTQRLLEILINKSQASPPLTTEDIALADKDALEFVQQRFPEMGIHKKG